MKHPRLHPAMELARATAARLAAAQEQPSPRHLCVAELEVGRFGVLDVVVDQVQPARTFQRKRGGEGTLCRATLSDATGSVDLVLWDDETRLASDLLLPGRRVIVRGATVKAGYRGGIELGLGSAVIEPVAHDAAGLRGRLVCVEPTQLVDGPDGPRFKAEAVLHTPDGEATVTAWGEAVKALQVDPGQEVDLPDAVPHPALPGFWIAGRPQP